jgi:hypothetical protein
MLGRRGALLLLAAALMTVGNPGPANAGVARPVALRDLVRESRWVIVGTSTEAVSRWEQVGKSQRIVTYHRIRIDRTLGSKAPSESEVWIRTLGGRVGNVGQIVHGEATVVRGEGAVLFLAPDKDGILGVTAMSQGHFPLTSDAKGVQRLAVSPRLSHLVGNGPSAVRRLVGRSIVEADELVKRVERGDE